jgi:hypothetical protein
VGAGRPLPRETVLFSGVLRNTSQEKVRVVNKSVQMMGKIELENCFFMRKLCNDPMIDPKIVII